MQKKILIAIDNSTSSRQTVEYAGRMQGLLRDLVFTLLHIQPAISQFLLDEARRSGKVQVELNRVAARNAEPPRRCWPSTRTYWCGPGRRSRLSRC